MLNMKFLCLLSESWNYLVNVPFVHGIVNKRIDATVGHGKPVECKIHVLRIPGSGGNWYMLSEIIAIIMLPHYCRIVMNDDEVGMIREPADGEDWADYSKHLHNLRENFKSFELIQQQSN